MCACEEKPQSRALVTTVRQYQADFVYTHYDYVLCFCRTAVTFARARCCVICTSVFGVYRVFYVFHFITSANGGRIKCWCGGNSVLATRGWHDYNYVLCFVFGVEGVARRFEGAEVGGRWAIRLQKRCVQGSRWGGGARITDCISMARRWSLLRPHGIRYTQTHTHTFINLNSCFQATQPRSGTVDVCPPRQQHKQHSSTIFVLPYSAEHRRASTAVMYPIIICSSI